MSFKHHQDPATVFDVTSESEAGLPSIDFHFCGDTCRAELCGATLHVEGGRRDGGADLRLTDAGGEVLADIVVNPRAHRDMTQNVIDVGSALLWSHWRYLEAQKLKADAIGAANGDRAIDEDAEAQP